MSGPTEIIVYRSPMEAAIWQSLSDSNVLFPIIATAVVFIVSVWAIAHAADKWLPWKHRKAWWTMAILWGVPGVLSILTFNHFYI